MNSIMTITTSRKIIPASVVMLMLLLTACTTVDLNVRENKKTPSEVTTVSKPTATTASTQQAPTTKGRGAYYQDDGPGDQTPEGLMSVPDAIPKIEPFAKGSSKPYTVFDKTYTPITDYRPFIQRGVGSWYGKKFHGQRTASGEIYDMYKMTAAHPILPIPSYARVTNIRNGKQVIVRVNDRGPFLASRIIDLSYTAAYKLGYANDGSAELQVERLLPDEIARMTAQDGAQQAVNSLTEDDAISRLSANANTNTTKVGQEGSGFYMQLGAYAQAQNAQAALEGLKSSWPPELPLPSVIQNQGIYRLHSGPFISREEASKAARQLQNSMQINASIVQK
jgi:rare lipoprotein A